MIARLRMAWKVFRGEVPPNEYHLPFVLLKPGQKLVVCTLDGWLLIEVESS